MKKYELNMNMLFLTDVFTTTLNMATRATTSFEEKKYNTSSKSRQIYVVVYSLQVPKMVEGTRIMIGHCHLGISIFSVI